MGLGEQLQFFYGLFMGTTVKTVRSKRKNFWPSWFDQIDDQLWLRIGGDYNCGILSDGKQLLLIDTGHAKAAGELKNWLDEKFSSLPIYCVLATDEIDQQVFTGCDRRVLTPGESISFSDEEIQFQEVDIGARLPVFVFKKRRTAFLGRLLFNRIHPIFPASSFEATKWIHTLEEFAESQEIETFVPAEGNLARKDDLLLFCDYLRHLSDPSVEFSDCRAKFDWIEILGVTSLEDNFDRLRTK